MDPRTPVIVGVGQINHKAETPVEPITLMVETVALAVADAGPSDLPIDGVHVVRGIWPYRSPGTLVAERIGRPHAQTAITEIGGNEVFDLVTSTALHVQRGELDCVVICGAETMRTRRRDKAAGRVSEYIAESFEGDADDVERTMDGLSTPREAELGVWAPVNFYAMVETALRHRLGESVDEHNQRVAAMWATGNAGARSNPRAWSHEVADAEHIGTFSPTNRPVAYPYPKLMTSNINVDQGAAVIMMSADAADDAGIPREQWVFPLSGVGARDHQFATNHWALDESPAMRHAGNAALELSGRTVDEIKFLDLYGCFPSSVQVTQRELGIDPTRDFTITGSLTFAGGPFNCYSLTSLIRAVDLLREEPEETALLTGNGGFFTKHSFLTLSGQPPQAGFRTADVQVEVDALPSREEATELEGTLESYTVLYDRDMNPERAIMSYLTSDGARGWTDSTDLDVCHGLIQEDLCGTPIEKLVLA